VIIAISAIFYFFPQIDLYFARMLHVQGQEFFFSNNWLSDFFHRDIEKAQKYFYLALIPLWLAGLLRKKPIFGLTGRNFAFIASTVLIATVLIVNIGLKDNWGRARPINTIEVVGPEVGKAHFTPVWVMA